MDRDFELLGKKFKLNKINAIKQFHIVRRITPILNGLLPVLGDLKKNADGKSKTDEENLDELVKFVTPIMSGLSKLSDEDAELVLYGLLEAVEIQQAAGNWAKVSSSGMLMMQDMELPILLQLAGKALMFNLSGFFGALPQAS